MRPGLEKNEWRHEEFPNRWFSAPIAGSLSKNLVFGQIFFTLWVNLYFSDPNAGSLSNCWFSVLNSLILRVSKLALLITLPMFYIIRFYTIDIYVWKLRCSDRVTYFFRCQSLTKCLIYWSFHGADTVLSDNILGVEKLVALFHRFTFSKPKRKAFGEGVTSKASKESPLKTPWNGFILESLTGILFVQPMCPLECCFFLQCNKPIQNFET